MAYTMQRCRRLGFLGDGPTTQPTGSGELVPLELKMDLQARGYQLNSDDQVPIIAGQIRYLDQCDQVIQRTKAAIQRQVRQNGATAATDRAMAKAMELESQLAPVLESISQLDDVLMLIDQHEFLYNSSGLGAGPTTQPTTQPSETIQQPPNPIPLNTQERPNESSRWSWPYVFLAIAAVGFAVAAAVAIMASASVGLIVLLALASAACFSVVFMDTAGNVIRATGQAVKDVGEAVRDAGRAVKDVGEAVRDAGRAAKDVGGGLGGVMIAGLALLALMWLRPRAKSQ